jgi:hypothetical protein
MSLARSLFRSPALSQLATTTLGALRNLPRRVRVISQESDAEPFTSSFVCSRKREKKVNCCDIMKLSLVVFVFALFVGLSKCLQQPEKNSSLLALTRRSNYDDDDDDDDDAQTLREQSARVIRS